MRIREAINRILWKHRDELHKYVLIIEDRLCGIGYRRIPFELVRRVDRGYVYLGSEDEPLAIPIHRVLRIERNDGEIVWERGD